MLSRVNRLSKQKDFEAVFSRGKSRRENFLVMRFLLNRQEESRFGLVVSAKVSKKAVVRNRLRRRLSEIIRSYQGGLKKGFDIVFLVKANPEGLGQKEMAVIVKNLLVAGGIL